MSAGALDPSPPALINGGRNGGDLYCVKADAVESPRPTCVGLCRLSCGCVVGCQRDPVADTWSAPELLRPRAGSREAHLADLCTV